MLYSGSKEKYASLVFEEFNSSSSSLSANMTDEFTTLNLLSKYDNDYRKKALQIFAEKWKHDSVVMNKWFATQSLAETENLLDEVKQLEQLPYFDCQNPNNVRSLYGCFASNGVIFHTDDGAGYEFIINKIIELDKVNSHIASGLATLFKSYPKLSNDRRKLLLPHFQRLISLENLSKDVYEIIEKIMSY